MDFIKFSKIPRYSREVELTEKIDGTNAIICIGDDGEFLVGSRTRWITPESDNYGFAAWAYSHKDELMALGPGRHWGEFWGAGIQRKYNVPDKRFWLFDTRYHTELVRPACCGVVPVIARGMMCDAVIDEAMDKLRLSGSIAAPGFMNPEGIVIRHIPSGHLYKKTLQDDESPKGLTIPCP